MESDRHAPSFLELSQALSQLDPARRIRPRSLLSRLVLHQPTVATPPAKLVHDHRLRNLPEVGRSATLRILATISFQDAKHRALDQVFPGRGKQAKTAVPDGAFQHEPNCRELPRFPRVVTRRRFGRGHAWAS